MLITHKIFILLLSKRENRILHDEIPYISRSDLTYIFKQSFAVVVLKYEYILIKTGSDEILRKNVDGAQIHHNEILHAKFGKNRLLDFAVALNTTFVH